jgi:single-strand DNA-binding protein
MNKVILMGRLCKDPDVRYSQGETPICIARYTLAVDRRVKKDGGKDQQTADFISCIAFGKSGEFAEKYLHKGTKICISGRIQTGSYTNKDGVKVYTTDVVVEDQEFAESKKDNTERDAMDDAAAQQYAGSAAGTPGKTAAAAGHVNADGFMNIPDGIDEELPFA